MSDARPQRHAARLLVDTLRMAPPGDARQLAKGWAETDAGALMALAVSEGAALLLQRRLKDIGVSLEGDAADQLKASAKRIVAQSLRGDAELDMTLAILESVDVPVVLLKGAAMRRLADRVRYAGARASSDVDIILPAELAQRGWDALVANGYRIGKEGMGTTTHHLPGLVGIAGIGVELHTSTGKTVTSEEAWRRASSDATTVLLNGRATRVPSDTELIWHSATHGLRHTNVSADAGVRLHYWIDIAALLAAGAGIDWDRLAARLRTTECPRPDLVRVWIATAAKLSGQPLPQSALGGFRAAPLDLERLLAWRLWVAATISDERWSNKLLDAGARGETKLPPSPGYSGKGMVVNTRHYVASRAARLWWRLRR